MITGQTFPDVLPSADRFDEVGKIERWDKVLDVWRCAAGKHQDQHCDDSADDTWMAAPAYAGLPHPLHSIGNNRHRQLFFLVKEQAGTANHKK